MPKDSPRTTPKTIFAEEFLSLLEVLEETQTSGEAEFAGTWRVLPVPGGQGVFREWEMPQEQDEPYAVCRRREDALLVAAALQTIHKAPLFSLGSEELPEGFPIEGIEGERWVQPVGTLRVYDAELIRALRSLAWVIRSPACLADLLEAAGPLLLVHAGRILLRRWSPAAAGASGQVARTGEKGT